MNIEEEDYNEIISMMSFDEPELSEKARELLKKLEAVDNLSSRGLRNRLYQEAYNQDYDIISDYDVGIIENLTRHFLDLIESPKNPLNSVILERTATVHTTIIIINQLFLSVNDTVELGWLEREYYATNKAKWDGVLFKVCDHKVLAGFVEFSGGANDRTSIQKERHDIQKLYKMMIEMLNGYPSGIKKQAFCLRYYDNTIFFREARRVQRQIIQNSTACSHYFYNSKASLKVYFTDSPAPLLEKCYYRSCRSI